MASRKRGWLFRVTWPVTSYFVTNIAVGLGYLVFKIFNRLTIVGKENISHEKNTLYLSNHQSMIDSFLIGVVAFYPKSWLKPSIIPWNPAAEENFYSNPLLGWFSDNWKCIRIKKGRKDVGAIFRMVEALKMGTMTLFPEGTRSRDGSIGKLRPGAGVLVIESQPTVIPVCIVGMDQVLPIGTVCPRFFKKIYISFGKPVDLREFYTQGKNKEVARAIMNRVTDRLRLMKTELEDMQRRSELPSRVFFEDSKKYNSQKI